MINLILILLLNRSGTKVDNVQGSIRLSRKKLLQMRKGDYRTINGASTGSWIKPTANISLNDSKADDGTANFDEDPNPNESILSDDDESDSEDDTTLDSFDFDELSDDEVLDNASDGEDSCSDSDNLDDDSNGDILHEIGGSRNDALWQQKFQELKEYERVHGDMRLPRGSSLANWASKQRLYFKNGTLPEIRTRLLNSIDFQWSPPRRNDAAWQQRFGELIEYKNVHGDSTVPKAIYPELSSWVSKQRYLHRNGTLPDDREKLLNSIEFQWSPGNEGGTR